MMTPTELLKELRSRGVEVIADGDVIRFRPGDAVTPELREAMRSCKDDLLAIVPRVGVASTPGPKGLTRAEIAEMADAWLRAGCLPPMAIWPPER